MPHEGRIKVFKRYLMFFVVVIPISLLGVVPCVYAESAAQSVQSFAGSDEEAWTWQYPVPQGNTIRAVRFSQAAGIAVGDYGTIIRTEDGGLSWSFVANSFAQHIQGLCHLSGSRWLAVGREGLILVSADDGRTWNLCQTDNRTDLFAVAFFGGEIGAAVGSAGTILWSNDGGISWNVKNSGIESDLRAIAFLTDQKAVAVGKEGVILKTADSGETWVRKKVGMDLFAIEFTNENNGYAAGGNVGYVKNRRLILRTTDGGESWQPQHKKWGSVLYGLTLLGQQDLLACGEKGTLLCSTDGGIRWSSLKSPTKRALSSVAFSGSTGVAVGSYGVIVSTIDSGTTWSSQLPEEEKSLSSISFANQEHGLAAGGEEMLLWSSDGGRTWTSSKTLPGRYIWSGCLLNPQTAVGLGQEGVIFRTADTGATWEQVATGIDYSLRRMKFVDENLGLAVGYSAIVATEDGGKTWTRCSVPSRVGDCSLIGIACVDKARWLVVGSHGVILASEDSGRTWTSQPSPAKKILRGAAWSDPRTATIVGDRGLILQSVDGGGWTERKSGTTHRLYAVDYTSPSTGFAVGEFGTILRTNDGGRTWKPENSHTLNHLFGLTCTGGQVFAVGWNTTILRRQVKNPEGGDK